MTLAIYSQQKAKVRVNGDLREDIKIEKGTRQGCPLSPLLFILTLEVFNNIIRKYKNVRGTSIKREKYKVQAFADDLVFILEEPTSSIACLMKDLTNFGDMAGMKVTHQKTKKYY